jgi:hypothetical protein
MPVPNTEICTAITKYIQDAAEKRDSFQSEITQ